MEPTEPLLDPPLDHNLEGARISVVSIEHRVNYTKGIILELSGDEADFT